MAGPFYKHYFTDRSCVTVSARDKTQWFLKEEKTYFMGDIQFITVTQSIYKAVPSEHRKISSAYILPCELHITITL